jgi:hypothetical protein
MDEHCPYLGKEVNIHKTKEGLPFNQISTLSEGDITLVYTRIERSRKDRQGHGSDQGSGSEKAELGVGRHREDNRVKDLVWRVDCRFFVLRMVDLAWGETG